LKIWWNGHFFFLKILVLIKLLQKEWRPRLWEFGGPNSNPVLPFLSDYYLYDILRLHGQHGYYCFKIAGKGRERNVCETINFSTEKIGFLNPKFVLYSFSYQAAIGLVFTKQCSPAAVVGWHHNHMNGLCLYKIADACN